MADVFKTVVAVVPSGFDPYLFQADAQQVSEYSCGFYPEFTNDPLGAPPVTHFMASGFIPETAAAAMAGDPRFIVSDDKWPVVVAELSLTRVEYPE